MSNGLKRVAAPIAAKLLKRITGVDQEKLVGRPVPGAAPRPAPSLGRGAFLFHTPELVNHFASVLDLLPAGSFDVVVCREAEGSAEVATAAPRWKARIVRAQDVLAAGQRYDFLVSNHPTMLGDVGLLRQLAHVHVRFMYAVGKAGWNLRDWNRAYDVILCYGPYHAEALARTTDAAIVQMGYPRMDRYFTEPTDRAALQRQYGCDPARPTVVWLPTWSSLSSMVMYGSQIAGLTTRFNVVSKLHPMSLDTEPHRVESMRKLPFTRLITDASDNLPLYKLADYMLFDYGGPPFAAVYTDKRLLLLNLPNAEQDPLTGADSPDITLRRHVASVNPGDDIAARLLDDRLWADQAHARRQLRQQYFAPHYGFASNVAALALQNLHHIVGARR